MTGIVIHIPTGRLIHEDKEAASVENKSHSEKSVLDITAPDGRSIFSIRKLVEDINERGRPTRAMKTG